MPEHPETYLARHVRQVCMVPLKDVDFKEPEDDPFPFYVKDDDAAVAIVDLSDRLDLLESKPFKPAARALMCCLAVIHIFSDIAKEGLGGANYGPSSQQSRLSPRTNAAEETEIEKLTAGKLSIHIGLGIGSVYRIHVGSRGTRRECFLSGQALGDASTCLDEASKGELCLPLSSWQSILESEPYLASFVGSTKSNLKKEGSSVIIDSNAAGAIMQGWKEHPVPLMLTGPSSFRNRHRLPGFTPPEGMSLASWFKEYINEATAHRLVNSRAEGQTAFSSLRKVSVVFLKLAEFPTDDADEGVRIAQTVMDIVLPPLKQFQGTMRQFNV
ncbi:hypothetical protein HDU96_000012 [Phlyctochytrium bullatum]|nr:hypothetical protein HDU96_000012 [Phlyctochytrium bullatum]